MDDKLFKKNEILFRKDEILFKLNEFSYYNLATTVFGVFGIPNY
jgi:hypothetical protein